MQQQKGETWGEMEPSSRMHALSLMLHVCDFAHFFRCSSFHSMAPKEDDGLKAGLALLGQRPERKTALVQKVRAPSTYQVAAESARYIKKLEADAVLSERLERDFWRGGDPQRPEVRD